MEGFRFFGLPREVRNIIYGFIYDNLKITPTGLLTTEQGDFHDIEDMVVHRYGVATSTRASRLLDSGMPTRYEVLQYILDHYKIGVPHTYSFHRLLQTLGPVLVTQHLVRVRIDFCRVGWEKQNSCSHIQEVAKKVCLCVALREVGLGFHCCQRRTKSRHRFLDHRCTNVVDALLLWLPVMKEFKGRPNVKTLYLEADWCMSEEMQAEYPKLLRLETVLKHWLAEKDNLEVATKGLMDQITEWLEEG